MCVKEAAAKRYNLHHMLGINECNKASTEKINVRYNWDRAMVTECLCF